MGWRCTRGKNPLQTSNTVWEQCLTEAKCAQMDNHAMILDNWRVTINEVVYNLCISDGSAHESYETWLRFHKVCARWIPKWLTEEHKCNNLIIWTAIVTKVALFLDALSVGIMRRPSKNISPNESHPVTRRQYTHQIRRTVTVVPLLHYVYYSICSFKFWHWLNMQLRKNDDFCDSM